MLLTTCMVDFFFCNIGLTSCITAKQTTTISNILPKRESHSKYPKLAGGQCPKPQAGIKQTQSIGLSSLVDSIYSSRSAFGAFKINLSGAYSSNLQILFPCNPFTVLSKN